MKQLIYTLLLAVMTATFTCCEKENPDIPPEVEKVAVYYNLAGDLGELYALINGQEHVSGTEVAIGSKIEFTAIPPKNYKITSWTVNGVEVANGVSIYTLVVEKETTLQVNFAKLSYLLSDDGTTLLKWLGPEEVIDMNNYPELKKITSIGAQAFYENKTVKSIKLSGSVVTIGEYAFNNCRKLKSIELNEGLQIIESNALYLAAITTLHIPSTVITLSEGKKNISSGIEGMLELESFTVASANKMYKAVEGVLFSKDGKKLIAYPNNKNGVMYRVPEGVVEVEGGSFFLSQHLIKIIFPSTLRKMGEYSLPLDRNVEWLQFKSNTPPTIEGDMWRFFPSKYEENTILYVYNTALKAYKNAGWGSYFKEIKVVE